MSQSTNERITLTAPDISCGHCVQTVETSLGQVEGVSSVKASADTKQIDLEFDPSKVSLDQVTAVLAEAGYPAQR